MQSIKIALIISYHGAGYDGWQDNFNNKSIEGSLKRAFFLLLGQEVLLDAASRTDKGVHAYSQVVITTLNDLKIPLEKLTRALNAHLPSDIRIKKTLTVDDSFHPSLSAKKKTYIYKINLKKVALPFEHEYYWHIPTKLDVNLIEEAKTHLLGTHDFSGFSNVTKKDSQNPICSISSIEIFTHKDQTLSIEMTADRFLYKMCRILVGTLVAIGRGQLTTHDLKKALEHKNRLDAGMTAPAHGLFLKTLYYPQFANIECN